MRDIIIITMMINWQVKKIIKVSSEFWQNHLVQTILGLAFCTDIDTAFMYYSVD
jgi:hypothetical protein